MTKGSPRFQSGTCPNPQCHTKLTFPEHWVSVECSGCGQRHWQSGLTSVEKQSPEFVDLLESLLFQLKKSYTKETHKVHDLSNCHCTILSSLMTCYGMDKMSGKARLLTEMGKNPEFDCGQLCDRAFLIDPGHLNITGYGTDRTGSDIYLKDTLDIIKSFNDDEERLVPIHADGDGHCLVHALSRALVGWELFWHPLRVNLKKHFVTHLEKYKMLFQDFIEDSEWPGIIHECDPDFIPSEMEPTGLRNVHIFGLANVLRRPIILLDSVEGIKSSGDYSAIFLPYFSQPSECKNKEGMLNKPLCIAWSSQGRNHFIPLVGVKGRRCPLLSRHIIQRAWGVNDIEIDKYVDFQNGMCEVGGEKTLQIGYIQRLTKAMGEIFFSQHNIAASLVADIYLDIFKPNGLVFGVNMELLLEKTKQSVLENQLFICLSCHHLALSEAVDDAWFIPDGKLYEIAVFTHKTLKDGYTYTFPMHDVVATYDMSHNKLIPQKRIRKPSTCPYCSDITFRQVRSDYSIAYENGDRTLTESSVSKSGYKNYWYGKEYSAVPKSLKVGMEWKGTVSVETVPWFQDDEDPSLNSNVYQIAQDLVQSKFPGEFGSELLVQKVVDQILVQTTDPVRSEALPTFKYGGDGRDSGSTSSLHQTSTTHAEGASDTPDSGWSPECASKAIIQGRQSQSIHKEDLTKSKTEMEIKQRTERNAVDQQSRLTNMKSKGLNKKRSESSGGLSSIKAEISKPRIPTSLSAPSMSTSQAQGSERSTASPDIKAASMTARGEESSANAMCTSKRVRLCMSDGRNLTVELTPQCTFSELQQLIAKHVNVHQQRYRILHGFPPTELKPPAMGQEDYVIPVGSGEKIMVNIISETKQEDLPVKQMPEVHSCPPNRDGHTTSAFGAGKENEVRDSLLQELLNLPVHAAGNSVDETIKFMKLEAALINKDFWMYAQRLPHLFSVNGAFYEQVLRDIGLEHGKHCTIASFEHRLFVYNQHADRLELCLEPYGHFQIENNVETRAHLLTPSSKCGLTTGQRPFSGQGHSLRSNPGPEDRMPIDIPMSPKRTETRPLNMFCDPNFHEASIEEEDEEEAEKAEELPDQGIPEGSPPFSHRLRPQDLTRNTAAAGFPGGLRPGGAASVKMVRKGPGYSELSPIPENLSNEKAEGLHDLVTRIEQAVETMGKGDDELCQTMSATPTSPKTAKVSHLATSLPLPSSDSSVSHSDSSSSRHSWDFKASEAGPTFDSNKENAPLVSVTSLSSSFAANATTPSKHQSCASPSTGQSPRQFSSDESGGDRNSAPQIESEMEVTLTSAVAAYAEKVASDIAAMDTDPKETTDNSNAKEQNVEGDKDIMVKGEETESPSETPMMTEANE